MAKLQDLQKYLNYEFSTGCYTGEDYKTFQTKYINYLRSLCTKNGWQLVNVGRNHYQFSAFIKNAEGKYVYLSISDVRFWQNQWYNRLLIRTATSEKDYRGGSNWYSSLPELTKKVNYLFNFA